MATLLAGLLLPSIAALAAEDKPSAPTIDERLAIVIEALNRLPDGAISDKPQIKMEVEKTLVRSGARRNS